MNPQLKQIIDNEQERQLTTLDLIASENYTSKAVREAVGSVVMHKYSEGYPGARYYEGNEFIDQLETLCIDLMKKVFNLPENWSANVQPLAGSNANLVVYNAILNPGDKILSMYLPDGGHLSHGWSLTPKGETSDVRPKTLDGFTDEELKMIYWGGTRKVNIVSKIFNVVQYRTNPETNLFDYDFIEKLAMEVKPKLLITGGTAYPRNIDYKRMREIADKVGAYYMADIAHEAGLIAKGTLDSPVGIADAVTFTTHKTFRGPKGAAILAKQEIIELVNKSIIPGMQGGPHNGTIAGMVQALFEIDTPEFKEYTDQVVKNAKVLAEELKNLGFKVVSGGTDKHLVLVDLRSKGIGGKYVSRALNYANIVSNMNTVPYDTGSPLNPSGLRLGTASITTRGMKEEQTKQIAAWINEVVNASLELKELPFAEFDSKIKDLEIIKRIKEEVIQICKQFTLENR